MSPTPYISVVVPVYNEEATLDKLFARLYPVLAGMNKPFEIIFVDDGSRDRSLAILREFYDRHPGEIVIIEFNGNFGQHMAIISAFERCRGEIIITIDADLQNPPEEIPRLVETMEQGYDAVGGYRRERKDTLFRRGSSWAVNKITSRITGIELKDYGCMLRAYHRSIIDSINRCQENTTFIPALAHSFASNPTEIEVGHEERTAGDSKYTLYKLLRLNFDLMTGFSVVPLQIFTVLGFLIAFFSFAFGIFLAFRRLIIGPEAQGLFTLFDILFFMVGILMFGVGILGEYVGRIYQEVRERPRFVIRKTYGLEE
ncbi:MAG: glycosyltransferase [Deltaproteobacteria bacterium]|nr:glycosyltransferase [Deltaproteobacteria bacterium]